MCRVHYPLIFRLFDVHYGTYPWDSCIVFFTLCDRMAGLTDGFEGVLRMLPQKEKDDTINIPNRNTSGGKRFKKRKVF